MVSPNLNFNLNQLDTNGPLRFLQYLLCELYAPFSWRYIAASPLIFETYRRQSCKTFQHQMIRAVATAPEKTPTEKV